MKYSVFKGKDRDDRYQGIVTKEGKRLFEDARAKLADLVKQPKEQISDGDTFEYLARGHKNSARYVDKELKAQTGRKEQRLEARRKRRRAEARKHKHGARPPAEAAARPPR